MKFKECIFLLSGILLFTGTACSSDDDYTPEDTVVKSFNLKYAEATRVEWEKKGNYKVADFYLDNREMEAWFENNGNWIMTETDIIYDELPQKVQDSLKASIYGAWRIEDIDKIERPDTEIIYIIDVEKDPQEYDLYYSGEGILLKEIIEEGNSSPSPTTIPRELLNELKRLYPEAKILEFEKKSNGIEIDILENRIHKEVSFNNKNEWIYTTWEINKKEIPSAVIEGLKKTEYANHKIDDADRLQTPEGFFYAIEVESGNKDIYLIFEENGTLVKTI